MENLVKENLNHSDIQSIVRGPGSTEDKVLTFKKLVPGVKTKEIATYLGTVSYTHLTLPTNREV